MDAICSRRSSCRRPASILAVVASVACGSNDRERDPVSYTLEEVTRYGWDSLADSAGPLGDADRAADAAVLGQPLDVVEGPDGKVYVVDAAYQIVLSQEILGVDPANVIRRFRINTTGCVWLRPGPASNGPGEGVSRPQ